MSEVRFGLLGPFEVRVDDRSVAISSAAERTLLTLLLLSPGRSVSATSLIDRLWAEETLPVDPMNALQLRISKLRRTLAAHTLPTLERENQGYRLDVSTDAVDHELFVRRLRQARSMNGQDPQSQLDVFDDALGLWRGAALADFAGQPWAVAEAARLEELRGAAIAERAHLAIALGRHAEVISQLEPIVVDNPTQEAMAGLLMAALYLSGRQADALDVYTRTRTVLDDELGLEPSTSLRSLHERVLRQDASLGAAAEITVPAQLPPTGRQQDWDRGSVRPTAPQTNIPAQLTQPIGRDAELESLSDLVAASRLVTLVGPGGAGKTTLGLTTASRLVDNYPDGVYLARLASAREASAITTAVADALGVPLDGAATAVDVRQRLVQYLHQRHMLLLVDNCEHIIDATATLIEEILTRCPNVSVLATSREALALPGEVQVPVGPLPTPPESAAAEEIAEYPAAQLFLRKADALRPATVLDAEDLIALGRVCRALDGMPLALELAAARTRAMSLVEIADRLDRRFALLTAGTRTAEDRQRTLRATVDWSYDLLTETEREVFARLSVFQGGWTLESADAVVADSKTSSGEVLNSLARLVEQSLVIADPGRTTRYRMLETLREYAAERLTATNQFVDIHQRHARHFKSFALRAASELRGHHQAESLERLREEQANVRAALSWYAGPGEDLDQALHLAGALGLFWHLGRHLEGRDLLHRLLNLPGGSATGRATALQALSLVERPRACIVHPSPMCAQAARESLEAFDRAGLQSEAALSRVLLAVEGVAHPDTAMEDLLGRAHEQFTTDTDQWGQAVIDFVRMEAALKQGIEEDALAIGRKAATAFRLLDDRWGLSAVLYHLGWGLRQFGRHDEAARVLEEAIDVASAVGLDNTAQWALADLGIVHVHFGDHVAAQDCFRRAARTSDRVGDGAGIVLAAYGDGLLNQVGGNWTQALEHFLTAATGFASLGTPVMRGQAVVGQARAWEALDDPVRAEAAYAEAAEIGLQAGEPAVTAAAWEGQARAAYTRGDVENGRDLDDRAAALRNAAHRPAANYDLVVSDSPRTAHGQ